MTLIKRIVADNSKKKNPRHQRFFSEISVPQFYDFTNNSNITSGVLACTLCGS